VDEQATTPRRIPHKIVFFMFSSKEMILFRKRKAKGMPVLKSEVVARRLQRCSLSKETKMVKEEQQKQSRHLERGSDRKKTKPMPGGGPAPVAGGADQVTGIDDNGMGIVDPRDITREGRNPLNAPWAPGADRAAS